jgi:hypothetical protein
MTATARGTPTLFISRAGEDKDIAIIIDDILRKAGYSTFIQDNHFGHTSFMAKMADGFDFVERGGRLVAVLSDHYQLQEHCLKEAHFPLIDDPSNRREGLIVLRIESCAPTGLLKDIPYVDLVPLLNDAERFAAAVRGAVSPDRNHAEADLAALYRRSPKSILHDNVRPSAGFIGRHQELSALESALWKGSGHTALTHVNSAVLRGLSGVGKTVLAQEYGWRNWNAMRACGGYALKLEIPCWMTSSNLEVVSFPP